MDIIHIGIEGKRIILYRLMGEPGHIFLCWEIRRVPVCIAVYNGIGVILYLVRQVIKTKAQAVLAVKFNNGVTQIPSIPVQLHRFYILPVDLIGIESFLAREFRIDKWKDQSDE
jgi:hypothetical protein